MTKLALFQGVTTPIADLALAIQNQGWQLGQVKWDKRLNAFTADAQSPHGETISKYGPDEGTAVANTLLAVTRRNHMRTTAQFKVGMWRTNFHERQREIAEAYRDAPIYDPKAVAAWKALGDDSMHRLHVLGGQLHIEPTNDPHPYKSADDMRKDVHEKRHYYLTQAGSAHPVWTSQQVAAFRAVHDILGHGVAGGQYDWPGRVLAASAHFPLLEPTAQQALFTEAVARPAFLSVYGSGPQKMALFPNFIDHQQDANNPSAHRGIHPSQTTAPVGPPQGFTEPLERTSAATRTRKLQWMRDVEERHGPDMSEAIHSWPDGWSIKRLKSYADAQREGEMMSNCFATGDLDPESWNEAWHEHPDFHWENYDENGAEYISPERSHSGMFGSKHFGFPDNVWDATKRAPKRLNIPLPHPLFSLRDPDNVPHASIDPNAAEPALGAHNDPIKPEYARRIEQWQDATHGRNNWEQGYGEVGPWGRISSLNTIDVNKGWDSGVDPLPQNAYIHHGDPLQMQQTMDNARLVDTGWSNFQRGDGSDDRERMKLAIVNAFRVVLLSPRKDLRWNAIHYQDISNIPGGVDDPKVYWDTLENSRRRWNEAQGIDPNAHMIYFRFLKPFEARIAANHPEKGWEWAQNEAKQTLFNWWTEEQERIQAEDSKKPAEKQRGADEIERRANEALARRMQLFLKPKDDKADVEDTQMSMFGSDQWKRRSSEMWSTEPDHRGAQQVEINKLLPYMEYDRRPGSLDANRTPESYAALRDHIAQHGITDPIYLDYNHDEGTGHISEGNHRLQIAHELGHTHVPLIVYDSRRRGRKQAPLRMSDEAMGRYLDYRGEYSYPQYMKPSDFKLATSTTEPNIHEAAGGQYNLLTGQEGLKYGAFMGTHLKSISQISQHADEILNAALEDVREHDGEGHHFRQSVLRLNVPGVGPKVCSFAWLLLQPMTSQLATIDTHMMDVLGHDYEKEMNNRDYYKFEREFRSGLDAAGYSHMPLGAGQWGMWDYKRTGPGSHQDHSAMRVLDPVPHQDIDWVGKAVNLKGESWLKQAPDWWQNTQAARDATGQDFDNTYGKEFAQNQIPYQGLNSPDQVISKTAETKPFSHYWDRAMPVGSSLESKARTLAEYAKADKLTHGDLEEWLTDHRKDTRLSDTDFNRFSNKMLKKLERLSKTADVNEAIPSFVHPQTAEVHTGMPGQSIMEHARLQTGLSAPEIWALLKDEHVRKTPSHA